MLQTLPLLSLFLLLWAITLIAKVSPHFVFTITAPYKIIFTRRPINKAAYYVNGCYFDTRTGNLAAAVVVEGKVLSPHYAHHAKPALLIDKQNHASIVLITAVDKENIHLSGGKKFPTIQAKLLIEGDDSSTQSYGFAGVSSDGKKIILGAAHGISLRTLRRQLAKQGFTQIMRLDGGSSTYFGRKWAKKLNNALAILE